MLRSKLMKNDCKGSKIPVTLNFFILDNDDNKNNNNDTISMTNAASTNNGFTIFCAQAMHGVTF